MNYSEYRKARLEGELLTLPSGLEVRVKKVTLIDLALNGEIPQTLHAATDDLLRQGEAQLHTAGLVNYGEMIALVLKACLVDPAVGAESDETHIALKDIEADDKLAIFRWANRGAAQLEKFRAEPTRPVGTVQSNGHDAHAPVARLEGDG